MKRLIVLLCLLQTAHAQVTIPGYSRRNSREITLAQVMTDGLHPPAYNGFPVNRATVWAGNGNIAVDTANGKFYVRFNGVWRPLADSATSYYTLQQVTNNGAKTTDTISAKAVRTNLILPDTAAEADYSMGVLPDPQYTTFYWPYVLQQQFKWFKDSADDYNMKALVGTGDMTQFATSGEFDRIDSNYDQLDVISLPYITPPGNHDYASATPAGRNTTLYNTYFGNARYTGKSWWGGSYGGKAENNWIKLDIGSHKWAIMGLEFYPTDSALAWAQNIYDSVTAADPTRMFWITTHAYITAFGDYAVDSTSAGTAAYGLTADNDGLEMWNKFLRKNKNIKIVTNGHFRRTAGNEGPSFQHFTDVGDNGNLIHQFCYDNQQDNLGGDGYFMRIKFSPATGTATTYFYSNYLNTFDSRLPSFTFDFAGLDVQNTVATKGLHVIGDATLDSNVALKNQPQFRVLYTGPMGRVVSKSNFLFNDFTNINTVPKLFVTDSTHLENHLTQYYSGGRTAMGIGLRTASRAQLMLLASGDNVSEMFFGRSVNPGFSGTADSNYHWSISSRASSQSYYLNIYEAPALFNKFGLGASGFFGARITIQPSFLGGGTSFNPNGLSANATAPYLNSVLSVWGPLYVNDSIRSNKIIATTDSSNLVVTTEWAHRYAAGSTFTPTGTAISNVDAVTPFALHYTRVGSTVTFSGTVDIDITLAVGSAVVELSLPIASNFSATTDAAGVIVPTNVGIFGGYIVGSVANNTLVLTVSAVGTGTVTYPFTGSYTIK